MRCQPDYAEHSLVLKPHRSSVYVAGTPARTLRLRQLAVIVERIMALGWWDWQHERLRKCLDDFRRLHAEAFLEKYYG